MRPLQAHCHRGLGTLYATTGQREQARTALSTAIEMYRPWTMTFWLPRRRRHWRRWRGADGLRRRARTGLGPAPTPAARHLSGRQRQFGLDEEALADLKDELLYAHPEVRDDAGRGLVWTGDAGPAPVATSAPVEPPGQAPLAYTPPYLAEKILTSRSALEGERKQVTVLFADLKGSMELLADRDPEEARQLLDPVLHRMMDGGAPLRGHRQPGHGRWHHGAVRGAAGP